MSVLRKYFTPLLLCVFCWYWASISFGTHTHIVNGVTVAHSHPGATSEHSHSEAQFAIIDLLTSFDADQQPGLPSFDAPELPVAVVFDCSQPEVPDGISPANALRGPPQNTLA